MSEEKTAASHPPISCPECKSPNTTAGHMEFLGDRIERVCICNDCPTKWAVSYADPTVENVIVHE